MTDTAAERLQRLLQILPIAARTNGVSLTELANTLGTTPRAVLRDIEEVTARDFYHPAGAVSQFQILLEEDHLEVHTTNQFERPIRLNTRELLALSLGLRTLAVEAASQHRAPLLDLASKLELALGAPMEPATSASSTREAGRSGARHADVTIQVEREDPIEVVVGDDEFRGAIADAVTARTRIRIRYLGSRDAEPRERTIEPYRLVHADGRWYVIAHDVERNATRTYRMDRILAAVPTDETFEIPQTFDARDFIDQRGHAFDAAGTFKAVVRYSPRIARWIAERTGYAVDPDGSVTVEHEVADPGWVIRHVLQYGGDAELVEPMELRQAIAKGVRWAV